MEVLIVIFGILLIIGAISGDTSKKRDQAVRQQNIDELVNNLNNEYRNK